MLVAVAVNAATDFASPYVCAADDAVLTGGAGSDNFWLDQSTETHYVAWLDASISSNPVATWTVAATRGCYVSVTLDLGPMVGNNKHVFEVKILDELGNAKGTVAEGLATDNGGDGYKEDYDKEKPLEGTILLPTEGIYTVELRNIRDWGKGSVKNVILTYADDAPEELIAVSAIELNKTELALEIDEVELLTATVSPDEAFDKTVTWESSDEAVATVSETGLVTAIAAGTATITAKAGEKTDECAVTVSAATVPDVDFEEPFVLSAKKAHLEGAVWKNDDLKLYGDGGHNKNYGTAVWTINVTKACIVSGVLNGVEGGHLFVLDLYDDEDNLLGYIAHPVAKKWSDGEVALDSTEHSTLTFAKKGEYTLKLRNTQEWSSGKVAGVTLTFVEAVEEEEPEEPAVKYCELPQGHLGAADFADVNGRILLTISKADGNNIKVAVKNNNEAGNTKEGLNFLWVNAANSTGVVRYGNGTHDEADVEEVSVIVEFETAQESFNFINIHWAYSGWVGEWAIDGLIVPLDELCDESGASDPTSIDNAIVAPAALKMIENGQLIIIRDGIRYNAQGQQF